ncbi:MAG TPA: GNAT family N-acetyltransferase [Steroidobacteraceae bacterium]|nr:GNAT family N-acetyltransferase [Steroidobacteraceae bacterium]
MKTGTIEYRVDTASAAQVSLHLEQCDANFVPALSGRVDVNAYAAKICGNAVRFEAWSNHVLIGLLAAYCNDDERRVAFITSVSIVADRTGEGIATRLLRHCIDYVKLQRMRRISLEVAGGHRSAIQLYEKCGFTAGEAQGSMILMHLDLEKGAHDT